VSPLVEQAVRIFWQERIARIHRRRQCWQYIFGYPKVPIEEARVRLALNTRAILLKLLLGRDRIIRHGTTTTHVHLGAFALSRSFERA
jgi:hypothetical protein